MDFKYKNVLIWGYGVSGRSVEKVLIEIDVNYTILDESSKINGGGFIDKLSKQKIAEFDLIVVSPGVDINRKEIAIAKQLGIDVISEIEFGYMFMDKSTKVIAVTGTNGKTSTVNMIYNMLKIAGYSVCELGNIGQPFSEIYGNKFDYVVLELSSFQLELCNRFRADISIILNIAPDHLDRHGTLENYINAKLKILKNQTKKDFAILCADDSITSQIDGINSRKILYSLQSLKTKYCIQNDVIYKSRKEVVNLSDYQVPAVMKSNILCVFAVSDILGIDIEVYNKMLAQYNFLSHRCEYVTEIDNIKYFNDSKATNIHAVQSCINSMSNSKILLLLGGRNKGLDFRDFITNLDSNIVSIIAFGECGRKIYSLRKYNRRVQFYYEKNLHKLMSNIDKYLVGIDTVLLSPACSSFDEFSSYMERGDFFKKSILEKRCDDDEI